MVQVTPVDVTWISLCRDCSNYLPQVQTKPSNFVSPTLPQIGILELQFAGSANWNLALAGSSVKTSNSTQRPGRYGSRF